MTRARPPRRSTAWGLASRPPLATAAGRLTLIVSTVAGECRRVNGASGAIVAMPIERLPISDGDGGRPPGVRMMDNEVRLWACIAIGLLFGVGVGLAAGDRCMITGVLAAAGGGAIVTPFVARLWRKP